jgi:hypothetical protein
MSIRLATLTILCLACLSGCNEVPTRDDGAAARVTSKPAVETARAPAVKQTNDEVIATDQNSRRLSDAKQGSDWSQPRGAGPASKGPAKPLRRDTIPNAADIGL